MKTHKIRNAAKRGDLVAVDLVRSMTDSKMRTETYDEWSIGYAHQVRRDGVVEVVRLAGSETLVMAGPRAHVHTMKNHQEQARRLAMSAPKLGLQYASAQDLRDAVLSQPSGAWGLAVQ